MITTTILNMRQERLFNSHGLRRNKENQLNIPTTAANTSFF